MHESLAWNQVLEHEAGLLDQSAVCIGMIEKEALLLGWPYPRFVLWMSSVPVNLQPARDLADHLVALVSAFDRAGDLADIIIDACV
jgi:hypothetical protein